ncbi:MAG TPA: adenylate/guanylate cyclase domain-containing protein [Parafilimonas sp.]|nr:adenylate/guanylate cyclase domain-containing protein [Parafilimonas sp.]
MPQVRHLSAIMFTDIEGYTALMQQDEDNAILIRNRHREILEKEHRQYNGRVIQYYGDGTLSIFQSAVEAVHCALVMQQAFCRHPKVPVRVGLHIGDIIYHDGQVMGDGVNVASRIESLGVAGSVLMSDKVNDEIRNHPELNTYSVGAYQLKNIERKIEVFALDHEGLIKPKPGMLTGKTADPKNAFSHALGEYVPAYSDIRKPVKNIPAKSIAVLPFTNMSNDPEQEYFSDGMAEEIISSLTHIRDLKVAGRMSSFQFKGMNTDLREVGEKLSVSTVLEGSIRKQGNRVRVTAQLISAEDGFHLWSEKYDRDLDDIFAIQEEIAISITEELKVTLLEKEKSHISKTPTQNREAYQLYLKGRFYWTQRGLGLRKCLYYYQQAVELDPSFALAHAGIADVYGLLGFYSLMSPGDCLPRAKEAASKAIQLDNSLAEVYTTLAFLSGFYDWNWPEARKYFQKALDINFNHAPAHYWYSLYLTTVERKPEDAIREGTKALELEPLTAVQYSLMAVVYLNAGRFEEALRSAEMAVLLDASSFLSYRYLGLSLAILKKFNEAIEALETAASLSSRHQWPLADLCWVYSVTGNMQAAQKIYDELVKRSETEYISGFFLACGAYSLQHHDKAFEFLEKAYEQKDGLLLVSRTWPAAQPMKNDPRFITLVEKINFPSPQLP